MFNHNIIVDNMRHKQVIAFPVLLLANSLDFILQL